MSTELHIHIEEGIDILTQLGFPKKQLQERSALTLLALINLRQDGSWANLESPLIGVTPIMNWMNLNYKKQYAPNSRETIRRQTLHQFVSSGLVLLNPDQPSRAVNSGKTVYQIESSAKLLLESFNSSAWEGNLKEYLIKRTTLMDKYAKARDQQLVPVNVDSTKEILLTPGSHSELIKQIIEEFAPRFTPNSTLVYAGDTGSKIGHFNEELLNQLGVTVDKHGKMPDVILYFSDKDWLILVESVTSHGPVDGKRHEELSELFKSSKAGLVYVTAFPDRSVMRKYLSEIAWETEVWVADAPTHLIHFNGIRFLGPY